MKWVLAECNEAAASALSTGAGLHPLIARLMVNRGIVDPFAVRAFLACDLSSLSDPFVFEGMDKAVARIRKAVSGCQKIVIYGDYDVDGVTGSSLLYLALKEFGAVCECYIPERASEGYGLHAQALKRIKAAGADLVITVDCGITAVREADAACSLGLDLIITDHHEFSSSHSEKHNPKDNASSSEFINSPFLPNAYAILHPQLLMPGVSLDVRDQVSGLTGVGIAFKVAQALLGINSTDPALISYLDLVALGTIADMGKITGENRILVKHGLDRLSDKEQRRPGLAALKEVSGVNGKRITVGTVGFTLAPRINAGGRVGRADTAFRLLISESAEESRDLAVSLDQMNRERQSIEENICGEAKKFCSAENTATTGAFVLCSEEWHPGVIGIVASRIVEEFYRPAALICVKDGIGKGSARSIPGFNLYEGIAGCEDLLLGFGGHKYAAGFTIMKERIPEFRDRLSALVRERIGPQGFVRTLCVDAAVSLEDLTADLLREIEKLGPFGQGNPEPRLGVRRLKVESSRIVGNNHLRLRLKDKKNIILDAIAFNRANVFEKKAWQGAALAAVFTPRLNTWNGTISPELEIRDIKTDK